MNNWNWFTPVTLTAKEPVAETVGNLLLTTAFFFQVSHNLGNSVFFVQSI
ncbi:Uncharacterised protein [Streptococcus pneumoniae]|nr:Uncharacterised protein [Streptococcus pneumoniae]